MNVENNDDERVSLTRALRERAHPVDGAILLLVPAVLGLVYLWPAAVRESLAFEYTDPSLLTAFASTFVHLDSVHLLVNLGTYALVVPVVFVLSVASGHRRRFYTVLVTFLLVFPFVLSYLNLAVVRASSAVGFSGVVMAFVGYLPLALADYLETHFDIGPQTSIAPMLFFLSLGLISVLSVQSVIPDNATVLLGTSGLVLAALLCALLYALAAYDRGDRFRSKLRTAVGTPGYFEVVVVAVVLFLGFPFVAFPADPSLGDAVVNLYVHLLGYALGFMVTFTTVETAARIAPAESPL